MLLKTESLLIRKEQNQSNYLHFDFMGKLSHEDSKKACDLWSSEFDDHLYDNYVLIWNCSEMNGFEPSAKSEWQRCLGKYHKRISKVIVISENIFIRGAARIMLKLYAINSEMIKDKQTTPLFK